MDKQRGFTLVELLVVIAIIGILASALLVSLNSARISARDARRISHMKQVQTVLELFYNKCGFYPGGPTTDPSCTTPATVVGVWDPATTGQLDDVIQGAGLGINQFPSEQLATQVNYQYGVDTSSYQSYVLAANLESDNAILKANSDLDGTVYGVYCDDTALGFIGGFYCVGN